MQIQITIKTDETDDAAAIKAAEAAAKDFAQRAVGSPKETRTVSRPGEIKLDVIGSPA